MAIDLDKIREEIASGGGREEVDITSSATLGDEIGALDNFANTIRNQNESLTGITDKINKNDFVDEDDYYNSIYEYKVNRDEIIRNSNDFENRRKSINDNYDVLASNQTIKNSEQEEGLLEESLGIFTDGFTKGVKGAVEVAEGGIGLTQSFIRQTWNLPDALRGDKQALDLQLQLQNDFDEYNSKFYEGIGKVLADNPVGNSFAALLNPIISTGLTITEQKEAVGSLFNNMAGVTQGIFKKGGIDMDRTAAAGYNEGLIELLTLGAGKVIFNKVKNPKGISSISKVEEISVLKVDAVMEEIRKSGNLKNLGENPLLNIDEVKLVQEHFDTMINKYTTDGHITKEIMDDVNNIHGLATTQLTSNLSTLSEIGNNVKRNVGTNVGKVDTKALKGELKNLNKAIKDGDLDNLGFGVEEAITGKNYKVLREDTIGSMKQNINKAFEGDVGAKIQAIKNYNTLVVKSKLDDVKLIQHSGIPLEVLDTASKNLTKQIQDLNRIGKLNKLEGSIKLSKFDNIITKKIEAAQKIFKSDIKAGEIKMKAIKDDLEKFITTSAKDAGLKARDIVLLKDKSGFYKLKNIGKIKSNAMDLIGKEVASKKISQIEKEVSKIKITTKGVKAGKTQLVKDIAEISRLEGEIKGLIDIKAPTKAILDARVELQRLKNKVKTTKTAGVSYIDLTELVELKSIAEDFSYLKKTGEGSMKDLDDILDRVKNLKSEANKRNTKRILDKELKMGEDANKVLFDDKILSKEAFDTHGTEVKNKGYSDLIKAKAVEGVKWVRNLFSTFDRFFIGLTEKGPNSTLYNVMRNNIDRAMDAITRDFTGKFQSIEKKWANWNKYDIIKRQKASKDLTVYARIKQDLADDLDKIGIGHNERQRIVKEIEGDEVLHSIYKETVTAFQDAFEKLNKTSKIEDGFEVPKVKNYFPLVRKGWQDDGGLLSVTTGGKVAMDKYFKSTMPSGFREARKATKLELDINANFMDVANKHLYNQYYYAHMKPQISYARGMYDKVRHGFDKLDDKQIKHYMDVVETNGNNLMPKNDLNAKVFSIVNKLSNNFAGAVLGGNAGTVIKQFLSEGDIMAVIGPEYWYIGKKHGMQYSLDAKKRAELYDMSPQIAERAGGENSLKELRSSKDLFSKMNAMFLQPMEWADTHVAIPAFIGGAIKEGVEKGYKFDINDVKTFTPEMIQAGERGVRMSMGSGRVIDIPVVLQNPITKVFFPFQTNVMTRLGLIFQDAPRKFKQGELMEASGIIAAYFMGSALDKIITAARLEARSQDIDELTVLDYILSPERFISGPQGATVKDMNETLFGEGWEELDAVGKIARLVEESFYSEMPIINNIHSTIEYGSPLIGVEGHAINIVKSANEAYHTDGLVNQGLTVLQNAPGVGSFAKQEVRARKKEKTLTTDLGYYIKVNPDTKKEID